MRPRFTKTRRIPLPQGPGVPFPALGPPRGPGEVSSRLRALRGGTWRVPFAKRPPRADWPGLPPSPDVIHTGEPLEPTLPLLGETWGKSKGGTSSIPESVSWPESITARPFYQKSDFHLLFECLPSRNQEISTRRSPTGAQRTPRGEPRSVSA